MNQTLRVTAVLSLLSLFIITLAALLHVPPTTAAPAATPVIRLEAITDNLYSPTEITHSGAPGDQRLFIAQQSGLIHVIDASGARLPTPFLNLQSEVRFFGESGLLGLAFHPNFAQNGAFFVSYVNKESASVIARFTVNPATPNVADPASKQIILTFPQPDEGHNGGGLRFGPDGALYASFGDGGPQEDPFNRAQNRALLLGKILRLDVDGGGLPPDCGSGAYTIPADNPFVGQAGACAEIWAFGLRNPWRISFDPATGDLFIADVGQNEREEVNVLPAGSGGHNLGWRCYEGTRPFNTEGCPGSGFTFPVFEYAQGAPAFHCSVTGGAVYRGADYPLLYGRYLLADFCSGHLWTLQRQGGGWSHLALGQTVDNPTTFGVDGRGELYVGAHGGTIYRIHEETPPPQLSLSKQGPAQVQAGAPVVYTLTVTNAGGALAGSLVITDTLPAGAVYVSSSDGGALGDGVVSWSLPAPGGGQSRSVQLTVTAVTDLRNDDYGVTLPPWPTVRGAPAVETAVAGDTLTLQKSGPAHVSSGAPIDYTLTVGNSSGQTLSGVLVTDTLPALTAFAGSSDSGLPLDGVVYWNLAPLPPHSTRALTLTVQPLVTGTLAVRNEQYGAAADGGHAAPPGPPVITFVDGRFLYLPLILR